MADTDVSAGERAAGVVGALVAIAIFVVCVDLISGGALFGRLEEARPCTDCGEAG